MYMYMILDCELVCYEAVNVVCLLPSIHCSVVNPFLATEYLVEYCHYSDTEQVLRVK